ncbi:hypothetical protein K7432_012479 [Basidiobolus ranarum]|uniref:Condensin complex subunit 2 n=1 Tax=Basidiobolus ranarum TaxID=34480 RepID=A0ABR2WKU7_9FUNG
MANNGDVIYSYFDNAFLKNWAGPAHWKLQRLSKRNSELPGEKQKKMQEKPFQVDFISSQNIDERQLFTKCNNTMLAKPSEKSAAKTLLPDDMQFSSKNLLTLFIKPQISMLTKKRCVFDSNGDLKGAVFGEEKAGLELSFNQGIKVQGQIAMQVSSNFYNDLDEDGGLPFPNVYTGVDIGEQLVTQPKLIKAAHLNYAKTAKKVDVKMLKDNIWKGLVAEESSEFENMEESEERKVGVQKFTDVITTLKQAYPQNKLQDISISFCFICLLHLANEKNLDISNDETLNDLIVRQNDAE